MPPPPQIPIPGLVDAIADAGTFDITYLDESVRVARGAGRDSEGVLRIFVSESGANA